MPATVVLGAQWGDEGKGKIIDALAEDADIIVRFNGGANAGHTIVIQDKTYAIHLLPSGIFRAGKMNLVGPGVACDLEVLSKELALADQFGSRVMLDESAPIVLPLHRLIDAARESSAGSASIGTTKRGIGPVYSDFWLRRGITLGDLRSSDRLHGALNRGKYWTELFAVSSMHGGHNIERSLGYPFNLFNDSDTIDWLMSFADLIVPYLGDTRAVVEHAVDHQNILFEGAQGVLLDAFHGSRPYCTSSLCTAAGVSATFGVYDFQHVYGAAKAYCTRVGAGPFPTELFDERGEELRRRGHEFGTTTGRARRCGWLDLPALRYACRMGGITELVITKLDVLTKFPNVRVCEAYRHADPSQTLTTPVLASVHPEYCRTRQWRDDLSDITLFDDLPYEAQVYLNTIEAVTKCDVTGLGVGPERHQILWK